MSVYTGFHLNCPFYVASHFSLFSTVYKMMPRFCKYIPSLTWLCSVKSYIESGYIYQWLFKKERSPVLRDPVGRGEDDRRGDERGSGQEREFSLPEYEDGAHVRPLTRIRY
jgi:hypothetical protein